MRVRVIRLAVAICAVGAVACGGNDESPDESTDRQVVGTSGREGQVITVTGCVMSAPPDGFMLTSLDDAIYRETRASDHHTNDPKGGERARHEQNPSAGATRYRLTGDRERLGMFVDREVDIHGRVEAVAGDDTAPATLHVEVIDATGASCGRQQEEGNDRGIMPTQDLPRKLRRR
jgi:hypothetical protein